MQKTGYTWLQFFTGLTPCIPPPLGVIVESAVTSCNLQPVIYRYDTNRLKALQSEARAIVTICNRNSTGLCWARRLD